MKTAINYIRVSTDEQAIKGYSQRYQKDHLEKYCLSNTIEIQDIVYEDYSAKTFDRPAWRIMMGDLRRQKARRPDYLLFTKWDRFSRNVGDAYYIISLLRKMGIQPQAIDQPLDLSIPENKIILSVYLSTSEAENERRSMNVKEGLHKAREEGRWTAHIPFGYKGILLGNNKRALATKEPEATFIRQAFDMVLENASTVTSIYNKLHPYGLSCSCKQFRRILRNPLYCGKIIVPAFRQQDMHWVRGIHEAIIEENKFLLAQDILSKRQKKVVAHNTNEQMMLRGLICCPRCYRRLTGSASKGKNRYYDYYHCSSSCGFRLRADSVNAIFIEKFRGLHIRTAYVELCKKILMYIRNDLSLVKEVNGRTLSQSIDRYIERILKAKELLLQNEVEYDDYILIKCDCEKRIHAIGKELQYIICKNEQITKTVDKTVSAVADFGTMFPELGYEGKLKLMQLILKNDIVITQVTDINHLLKPSILNIFHTADYLEIKHSDKISQTTKFKSPALIECTHFVKEVMTIENGKTTIENAQEVVAFLMEAFRVIHQDNSISRC